MGEGRKAITRCGASLSGLLLLVSGVSLAEPVVIHDSGRTRSLVPFLSGVAAANTRPLSHPSRPTSKAQFDIYRYLPVRTPELSPGKVVRRPMEHGPTTPLFLIGSDRFSQQWLEAHRDRLLALGATGLLIQADTVEDLQAIARRGQGLMITPVSGSDLAHHLGIRHYPVLISREGIEQ